MYYPCDGWGRTYFHLEGIFSFRPILNKVQRDQKEWNVIIYIYIYPKHTLSFIRLQRLIMSPSQLGPFRKLILRAGCVHFALELHDIQFQPALFSGDV